MKRKNFDFLGRGTLCLLIASGIVFLIWFTLYMDNSYRSIFKNTNLKFRSKIANLFNNSKMIFEGEKIVHIDLKGAPPKISYYKDFFTLISKLGATGIIIEYEDMFPYSGKLENVSAGNAYSLNDIKEINDLAQGLKLKVIPLIPTFGHLEFLLKGLEYQYLREVIKYPQVICPSNINTLPIIMEMIDQVVKAHPNSEIIHIGADEVYIIGECTRCLNRMLTGGMNKESLFLSHVIAVANQIKNKYPKLRILVWDDEFRKIKVDDLRYSKISSLVEPVVWSYVHDVYLRLGPEVWNVYREIFPKIWIASAYKGATGSNKYITNAEYHLENHRSWMRVVEEYSHIVHFEGIILTGWQRYDHFAVLCELLPVGIPSLALCLHQIMGITSSPLLAPRETTEILQCANPSALLGPVKYEFSSPKCHYPGADILERMLNLDMINRELNYLLDSSAVHGWMSDYNIKYSFSNVHLIESSLENVDSLGMELNQLEKDIRRDMEYIYDNYTISEWCDTYLEPIYKKIKSLGLAKEKLLDRDIWPKRPLTINENKN